MLKVSLDSEQIQHYLHQIREDFWGDLNQRTRLALKRFLEAESERERDRWCGLGWNERAGGGERKDLRNGYYERDFVTAFGTIRLRIARSRGRGHLPRYLEKFQRRAPELSLLIREMFLRGVSTRQVGRVLAVVTGEPVSAQTVSRLTRSLDAAVRSFHRERLADEWRFLYLDGVSLRVRGQGERKRVQMLVAYGVAGDGRRRLLAFMRSRGESQAAWEGLLEELRLRGLRGAALELIVTDGCPGLAAALQTVYPRVPHQRCWVHKMRNILGRVRRRDRDAVKAGAQAIYLAEDMRGARAAFLALEGRWLAEYPQVVRGLERDLPELLSCFRFPFAMRKKLRTTNVIERCFVEIRRRTRPMVCFVNPESVDRIIFSIFNRFNNEWEKRTLKVSTQAA